MLTRLAGSLALIGALIVGVTGCGSSNSRDSSSSTATAPPTEDSRRHGSSLSVGAFCGKRGKWGD